MITLTDLHADNITEEIRKICVEKGTLLASHWLFQVVVIQEILCSIIAFPLLLRVLKQQIIDRSMHSNIKILLFGYFLTAAFQVFLIGSVLLYQFILWHVASHPCSIFPSSSLYMAIHAMTLFSLLLIFFLLNLIWIERAVATRFYLQYEIWSGRLGAFMTIFAVLMTIALQAICYIDEDFDDIQFNVLNSSSKSASSVNNLFIMVFVMSSISLVILYLILHVNKRRKKSSISFTLSSKYQTVENVELTSIIAHLLLFQTVGAIIYSLGTLLCRLFQSQLFGDDGALFNAVREIFYIIPLVFMLLPFLTSHLFEHVLQKKMNTLNSSLNISDAREVAVVYMQNLCTQWNNIPTSS